MLVNVTFVRPSICECGYRTLNDNIDIGTQYHVDPDDIVTGTFTCGGCGRTWTIRAILAKHRLDDGDGYLPVDIFDMNFDLEAK